MVQMNLFTKQFQMQKTILWLLGAKEGEGKIEGLGWTYTDCYIQNGLAVGLDGKESAEMWETLV